MDQKFPWATSAYNNKCGNSDISSDFVSAILEFDERISLNFHPNLTLG